MSNIVEKGKRGAELLGDYEGPAASRIPADLLAKLEIIKRLPSVKIPDQDTADGTKRDVQTRPLVLRNRRDPQDLRIFNLVHDLAEYRMMIYAQQGGRQAVMGMLSPNYDGHGQVRLPSIKVLPLRQAMPLTSHMLPDAEMATMLTGAANAEGAGVGGHDGPVSKDYEHNNTIYGALSLDDPTIALSHKNHAVRRRSSLATGLTNGELGNLYTPTSGDDFPGFGEPIVFNAASLQPNDTIYVPDSFLGSPESFGMHYDDSSRIFLGAGLRTLQERRGDVVFDELDRLGEQL